MENEVDSVLWLELIGRQLEESSTPIYELGRSFTTVQEIINRTYLYLSREESSNLRLPGYLPFSKRLSQEERFRLSLQVAYRRKGSDIYGFLPFLKDPIIQQVIGNVASEALKALGKNVVQPLIKRLRHTEEHNIIHIDSTEKLTVILLPKLESLAYQISPDGSVQSIKLYKDQDNNQVIVDNRLREDLHSVKSKPIQGNQTTILGQIDVINKSKKTLSVTVLPKRRITIYFKDHNGELFEKVLSLVPSHNFPEFVGRPIYRIGENVGELEEFREFIASEIIL